MKRFLALALPGLFLACQPSNSDEEAASPAWSTDFFDDFDQFNPENWQDQRIWVNNEQQCYVPDGNYGTREVSDGTLKLRVVKVDSLAPCDNLDKFGKQHPPTQYLAGRICSKKSARIHQGKMDS